MIALADRVVKVTLTAQVAQYEAGMMKAAQATRSVGSESEKLAQKREAFQSLGRSAVVLGGSMTALGLAVAKTGIEYNSLQQKSRAALTTLLGSAEAANAQMDKLDAFARTSPFSKQTFISAQQQMLAFGIETRKVIPYLDAVQNAVAAAGGSNADIAGLVATMSKIQSSAKLTATDLMEFGNRGVDAAGLIGASMGKTGAQIREEITAGSLDATTALDALVEGMNSRFDGAADNVKNTFEGAMDRVKAAWRDVSADLMKPLVDPNGGGALVGVLNWVADLMRSFQQLPEPVKYASGILYTAVAAVALIGGAALLAVPKIVAFKIAMETLSASSTAAGKAFSVLGGALRAIPYALVAAGMLQVGNQLSDMALTAIGAKKSVDDLSKSFDDLGTKKTIDDALGMTGGMELRNATSLGWLSDATNTARGWLDQLEEFNPAARTITQSVAPMWSNLKEIDKTLAGMVASGDARKAADGFNYLASMTDGSQGALDRLKGLLPEYASALKGTGDASQRSADDTETATDAYREQQEQVEALRESLSTLLDQINAQNSAEQQAIQANAQWLEGLSGLVSQVEQYGTSLDQSTEAGSRNAAMLAGLAGDAQRAAEAQLEVDQKTMGAEAATSNYIGTLAAQRARFEESAVAAGFNAEEVSALADEIFALPSEKEVRIIAETAAAAGKLAAFQSQLNNLVGKTVTVNYETVYSERSAGWGIRAPDSANGNIFEYANGGFAPGIYKGRPGAIHKFAEPETRWEAYISGKPGQEARNMAIWAEAGHRLGVEGFANGGFVQPQYVPSQSGMAMDAGMGGVVELGPKSLRALSREVVNMIDIDQGAIAGAANAANANTAWRGGY